MRTPADLGWGSPHSLDYANMVRCTIWPGHTVSVRSADVGVVFAELIRRLRAAGWHGPDQQLDEWGYNKRLKRWAQSAGQNMTSAPLGSWSDHAWGTAVDLDTAVNPMYDARPANPQAHTSMPVAACAGIAAALGLEWGGAWSQPWDPQHWQIAVTPQRLRQIVSALAAPALPDAHPQQQEDDVSYADAVKAIRDVLNLGDANLAVPPGQKDNSGLAAFLVGNLQAAANRNNAAVGAVGATVARDAAQASTATARDTATVARDVGLAAQLHALGGAGIDPADLAQRLAGPLAAALKPLTPSLDVAALTSAAATALREIFADVGGRPA